MSNSERLFPNTPPSKMVMPSIAKPDGSSDHLGSKAFCLLRDALQISQCPRPLVHSVLQPQTLDGALGPRFKSCLMWSKNSCACRDAQLVASEKRLADELRGPFAKITRPLEPPRLRPFSAGEPCELWPLGYHLLWSDESYMGYHLSIDFFRALCHTLSMFSQ